MQRLPAKRQAHSTQQENGPAAAAAAKPLHPCKTRRKTGHSRQDHRRTAFPALTTQRRCDLAAATVTVPTGILSARPLVAVRCIGSAAASWQSLASALPQ